jgi:hypothetical protein
MPARPQGRLYPRDVASFDVVGIVASVMISLVLLAIARYPAKLEWLFPLTAGLCFQ